MRSSFRTYQDFLSYVTHGCRKLTSEFVMQSDENRKRFIKDAFVDASSAMQVASQTVATLLDEQTKAEGQNFLNK